MAKKTTEDTETAAAPQGGADIVVYNGAQYRVDRLPEGVDVKDCVPVDEWFKKHRVAGKS